MVHYLNPSLIYKRIHKAGLDGLVQLLNIIKSLFIPLFPKSPKEAQGYSPPACFPFLSHVRVMPTQNFPSKCRMHDTNHSKKRNNQICLWHSKRAFHCFYCGYMVLDGTLCSEVSQYVYGSDNIAFTNIHVSGVVVSMYDKYSK